MKVELDKSIALPASADAGWLVLSDVEAVAGCMPGAKITERIDERHYKGTVSVRVGPASMSFRGEIEVRAIDPAARTIQLIGKGTDSTGSSGASMDLTARIEPVDAATSTLRGLSVVSMSGRAATFGGRLMNTVADQILGQFGANFAARVAAATPRVEPPPAAPPATAPVAPAPPVAAPPAAAANEINGLALLWALIKAWWRGLFAKKPV